MKNLQTDARKGSTAQPKPYRKPSLIVHGRIADITRGGKDTQSSELIGAVYVSLAID